MNAKIIQLLLTVVANTNSNHISWKYDDCYRVTLKNGIRICISRVSLITGAPQYRYILTVNDDALTGIVNPWDDEEGYEVWLAVYNAARENVYTQNNLKD